MSGNHNPTRYYNIEFLLHDLKLQQDKNTTVFYKNDLVILSPAAKVNPNKSRYWFDIREVNLDRKIARAPKRCYLLVRIVPTNDVQNEALVDFVLCSFELIETILTAFKIEKKTGKKTWRFHLSDDFSTIININSKETITVKPFTKEEIISKLCS